MKTTTLSLLLLFAPVLGACSEENTVAAKDAMSGLADKAQDLDLSSMSPEGMKEKAGEFVSSITEKLSGITDLASAEKMKEQITPMLDKLGSLKTALGDKLGGLDSLGSAVTALKEKFAEGTPVRDALAPLIEKIQGLMG